MGGIAFTPAANILTLLTGRVKYVFAQIVYVDFVGRNEEEAIDLLLKRVRGDRGKPATPPQFPGGESSEPKSRREVAVRLSTRQRQKMCTGSAVLVTPLFVGEVGTSAKSSHSAPLASETPPAKRVA